MGHDNLRPTTAAAAQRASLTASIEEVRPLRADSRARSVGLGASGSVTGVAGWFGGCVSER
jgi:hypothetical protein